MIPYLGTLGFWRKKKPELLEPVKGLLLEDYSLSSDEFYSAIEQELAAREIPDLTITRELFAEGGLLSSKREYLRMRRERLVFDICAAPFGTSYFFSTRFAIIPVLLYIWQLILVLIMLAGIGAAYWALMGVVWGATMFVLNLAALFVLLRNLEALKLHRLDDFLIRVPVFGIVYETFFRPETYYRIDTRTMYIETVKRIVERKIDEVTGSQGIQLVEIESLKPRAIGNLAAMVKRWTG
jgi:hypothetical protein